MSAFCTFHPFTKQANNWFSAPTALMDFLKVNGQRLASKLRQIKQPEYLKTLAKNTFNTYKPQIIGGAAGILPGAYLGNEAFNNSLPPVRELPHIEQSNYIELAQQPYTSRNV